MCPAGYSSSRVALREFTTDDVDAVHAVYGSSEATEHLSFEPRSRAQVGYIVARSMTSAVAEPRTEYALAVCAGGEGGRLIGFARLATEGQRAGTVGFALHPDVWRQGYGLELVRALLDLGFGGLGLHRIWAARSPENTASARVLEKVGMVEESRIRHHVFVRGAWRDSVVHSILEDEHTPPG